MQSFISQLRKLDNGNLSHMLHFCYSEYRKSAETLETALQSHIRREPIPVPIWALQEAYDANRHRFQLIMAEIERREIP